MPPAKPKPSEIAAEAKRTYIPYIEQTMPHLPTRSVVHPELDKLSTGCNGTTSMRGPRIAVIDGDPVDVALDWYDYEINSPAQSGTVHYDKGTLRIPVANMANEKRAGGDWESGLLAPEENLCRRSNLVHCLTTPWNSSMSTPNYPIPTRGGIYSPNVVVFRSGPDRGYQVWKEFKHLPVISVAPIRRPKLDEFGKDYSFNQERELMKEKMRTVLRIAAIWKHRDLCLGAFGAGPSFRNPVRQLASMWKDILFTEPEFQGLFLNVVFAIESASGSSAGSDMTDYEVFKSEFDPSNIFKTAHR